jgi:hypothetical protein
MESKLKIAVVILVVALATAGVAFAVTHWSQTISWSTENESFTVTGASTTVNLNVVSIGSQHTETYTVTNNGNTAVDVQVSTAGSGYTESWNATSTTLASYGDSAGFELTLTINGEGSCTVNIDAV